MCGLCTTIGLNQGVHV